MSTTSVESQPKDRRLVLRLVGLGLILIGVSAAFLGPLEMFCFYLFSEGGMFHFEGFKFGSFMFGNLAAQIMGYYFIAAVLVPVGYGTLRLRSWSRHLSLAIIRFWIVAGLPLIVAFFFVLISSKDIAFLIAITAAVLLMASYLLLPAIAIRFYENLDADLHFNHQDANLSWIEVIPVPILALGYVLSFFILILHTQIFFNGIFPIFGAWKTGLEGIILIDVSIISLIAILWGIMKAKKWAWWGVLVYFGVMTFSYIITFLASSWDEILSALNFPSFEMEILQGLPLKGYYFAIFAGLPFFLTIVLIVRSRPYFQSHKK